MATFILLRFDMRPVIVLYWAELNRRPVHAPPPAVGRVQATTRQARGFSVPLSGFVSGCVSVVYRDRWVRVCSICASLIQML